MRDATLCLLIKPNKILLGMKKRGFGKGRWNGYGGKVEDKENIVFATVRENFEESGLIHLNIEKVAEIKFYFTNAPFGKSWDQVVYIFISREWKGTLRESNEILPKWFSFNDIPYSKMWNDDTYWLPKVLEGKKLVGSFTFGKDNSTILKYELNEIENFQ